MKKRNSPILLFLSILTLTQLMCSSWTRYAGSNDITLCTHIRYQLEDGTPVNIDNPNNTLDVCIDYPTQQECNAINAAVPKEIPNGYSLVSYSAAESFDCSSNVEKGIQHRDMTVILKSESEAPTEEPAEASALPTEEPAPLKPFLTEEFTSCDNVAGYVNFTIAEDAPAYDPATLKVTFNGYPVSCEPAANNSGILTCKYPPVSYAPPAGVQVFIGEELVNEFDFNGGKICDPAPQPNNNTDPDPTEEPAPTADPGGSG